jgi:hypothetical protein
MCIFIYRYCVRTGFEKFKFHIKCVNNICICVVIQVLTGQVMMYVECLLVMILHSISFKNEICFYCQQSVWFAFWVWQDKCT